MANRESRERKAGHLPSERGRSSEEGSRNRLAEGLRNTEVKRETDIRNSLGPTDETPRMNTEDTE